MSLLEKIISGGQTGADRTALEVAEELGIPTGGWVPLGCWTDEGQDPTLVTRFHCEEHASPEWKPRTQANVADSDGTVWFGDKSPGYWCTRNAIRGEFWIENPDGKQLADWIVAHQIEVLNVAGNRKRKNPAIVGKVQVALREAISHLRSARLL